MNEVGCTILLNGYYQSIFQEFEVYLRKKRVSEVDIELISKQYKSKLDTYKLVPGNYPNNYTSDALLSFGCQLKYDDSSTKTRLLTDKILRFYKNSVFIFLLGFSAYWDYKNNKECMSQKTTDLKLYIKSFKNRIH